MDIAAEWCACFQTIILIYCISLISCGLSHIMIHKTCRTVCIRGGWMSSVKVVFVHSVLYDSVWEQISQWDNKIFVLGYVSLTVRCPEPSPGACCWLSWGRSHLLPEQDFLLRRDDSTWSYNRYSQHCSHPCGGEGGGVRRGALTWLCTTGENWLSVHDYKSEVHFPMDYMWDAYKPLLTLLSAFYCHNLCCVGLTSWLSHSGRWCLEDLTKECGDSSWWYLDRQR